MSRTLWSCGLIRHNRKVEGSNLIAVKNLFQFKSTKISLRKSEQKKKGTETWKALNNDKINPINSLKIKQKEGDRMSRSATNGNLMELGTSNMAKQTFINDSARVWNRAPQTIKNCTSLYSAKKEIKKFVKTLPV